MITVVVVDDSAPDQRLAEILLKHAGHTVMLCGDGQGGLDLIRREHPDLIIADPQLPDMEDWELIQQLATSGMYGDIPVLVLSGLDKKATEAKCMEYGVVDFFLKPFNPVVLLSAIDSLVKSGGLNKGLSVMAN